MQLLNNSILVTTQNDDKIHHVLCPAVTWLQLQQLCSFAQAATVWWYSCSPWVISGAKSSTLHIYPDMRLCPPFPKTDSSTCDLMD